MALKPHPLYAGEKLRALRHAKALKQAQMAALLDISVSYLSQMEGGSRPLPPALLEKLSRAFPIDWQENDDASRRIAALAEAMADPMFAASPPVQDLPRIAQQQGELVDRFVRLHAAYRNAGQRLQMLDEAIASDVDGDSRLPWEEVRDWFHQAGNYVDGIDRAGEALAQRMAGDGVSPSRAALEGYLRSQLGLSLSQSSDVAVREFDATMGHLSVGAALPPESQRFQLAHQLGALALRDAIAPVVEGAGLRTASARHLLFVGLANYAAGAILMPYGAFRRAARAVRHDIDRLCQMFAVSFEQACHRLSTLQRQGERGIPFFFCRVDMAGNITKRHSATRLQFARFGGACPLWIVHEAVAIPDRILVQLAETADDVRYVSMAKGLVKPSGSYQRAPRRYAVALGCETGFADEFIYADGLDLSNAGAATRIGSSCRICPREDCDQRAFPASDRAIIIDPDARGIVPYRFR